MTGLRNPEMQLHRLIAAVVLSVLVLLTGILTWKAERDKDCYTVQMLMQSATPNNAGGIEYSTPVETRVNLCLTPIGEQQENEQ